MSSNCLSIMGETARKLSSAGKNYSSEWFISALRMVISGDNGACGDGGAVAAAGIGCIFSMVLLRTTALG